MSTKGGSTGQEKEPLEKKIRLNPLYGALQTNGTVCQGAVAKIKSEAGGDDGGGGRDECIGVTTTNTNNIRRAYMVVQEDGGNLEDEDEDTPIIPGGSYIPRGGTPGQLQVNPPIWCPPDQ